MSTSMTRPLFFGLLAAGFIARIALMLTSIGTNDAAFFMRWSQLVTEYGIAHAYAHHALLNHPPLSLAILRLLTMIASSLQVELTDLLRLLQSLADVASAGCLVYLARAANVRAPHTVALMYFLSPVAILVSGFHCNTDPTMVLLILVAVALHVAGWPLVAGAALAAATGIKILPLLILPLFAILTGRLRFLAGFALTFAAIFAPAVIVGGMPVVRNVFGYAGLPDWWGIPSMLFDAGHTLGIAALMRMAGSYVVAGRIIELLMVAVVALMFARGEQTSLRLLAFIGITYCGILVFAPGIGVQYLIWPLPFLPFVTRRGIALAVSAASSALLVAMYTSWSGGFPWWFANSMNQPWRWFGLLRAIGYLAWASLAVALISGVRRQIAIHGSLPAGEGAEGG